MEMKEYMTPDMEVVTLKLNQALLVESMDAPGADETNPDLPERE